MSCYQVSNYSSSIPYVFISSLVKSVVDALTVRAYVNSSAQTGTLNDVSAYSTLVVGKKSNLKKMYSNNNVFYISSSEKDVKFMKNINRLTELREYRHGWNGRDAAPINQSLIDKAELVIKNLKHQPFIAPTNDSTIEFEFYKQNGEFLEIEFLADSISLFTVAADGSDSEEEDVEFSLEYITKAVDKFYAIM